jgi:PST family polysaccharide transporter
MSEFRKRVIAGIAWNSIAQIGTQVINFVTTLILTRLLPPSSFGLIAMAGVVTGFFAIFPGLGLGAALVQKADAEERHFTSIYWVNLFVSLALALMVAACGPFAARSFSEAALTPILGALALQFPLSALGSIHRVHLRRALRFDVLSRTELLAAFLGGVVGVVMALAGFGVWSIVARALLTGTLSSLFVHIARPYWPGRRVDRAAVRECAGFGLNMLGWEVLSYVFRNGDNFLVGKYLGAVALGFYSRAYTFMLVPLLAVVRVISGVLFPALSQIQDDLDRVRAVFLRVAGVVALVSFPIALGFAVVAEPFVRSVLGARWAPAIPLFHILCPTGIWDAMSAICAPIYRARGRADLHLRVTVVGCVLSVAAFVVGLRWGVQGVAFGYVVSSAIRAAHSVHYAAKLVHLRWRDLVAQIGGVLLAGLGASAAAMLAQEAIRTHVGPLGQLVGTAALFAAVYAALVIGGKAGPYRDLVALRRSSRKAAPPAA